MAHARGNNRAAALSRVAAPVQVNSPVDGDGLRLDPDDNQQHWISDAMEARWPGETHASMRRKQVATDALAKTFRDCGCSRVIARVGYPAGGLEMQKSGAPSLRFGGSVQSGPIGYRHRHRNTIFRRTLPDCDPGERSVVGGDILQRRPSFKAARFIAPPFYLSASARRRRLRRRRAKNESAALARRDSASVTGEGKIGGRPKAARPVVYAANGGSSVSGPLLSSVRGTMLAERSKATRAAACTLPTPPRDV